MNSIKQKIDKYINKQGLLKTPAYYVKELFNDICDNLIDGPIKITYKELKDLRDKSLLKPGREYQIIDYVTSTILDKTRSANNYFDIIVKATNENTLSENARAIYSERDTSNYFGQSDLSKWELKYSLDNDSEKYAWISNNDIDQEIPLNQRLAVLCTICPEWLNSNTPWQVDDYIMTFNLLRSDLYTVLLVDENNNEWDSYRYKYEVIFTETLNINLPGIKLSMYMYFEEKLPEESIHDDLFYGYCTYNISVTSSDDGLIPGNYYIDTYVNVYQVYNNLVDIKESGEILQGVVVEGDINSSNYTISVQILNDVAIILKTLKSDTSLYLAMRSGHVILREVEQCVYIDGSESLEGIKFTAARLNENTFGLYPHGAPSSLDLSRINSPGINGTYLCELIKSDGSVELVDLTISTIEEYRVVTDDFSGFVKPTDTPLCGYPYSYKLDLESNTYVYFNIFCELKDFFPGNYDSYINIIVLEPDYYIPRSELEIKESYNEPIVIKAGKGVIYYMKDEFGNECPYDFKNILFYKEDLSIFSNYLMNPESEITSIIESYFNKNLNYKEWYYTFSDICMNLLQMNNQKLPIEIKDLSLTSKNFKLALPEEASAGLFSVDTINFIHGVRNNIIKPNYVNPYFININTELFKELLLSIMNNQSFKLLELMILFTFLESLSDLYISTAQYLPNNIFISTNIIEPLYKIMMQETNGDISNEDYLTLNEALVYSNVIEYNKLNNNSFNNIFLLSNGNHLNNYSFNNIFTMGSNNNILNSSRDLVIIGNRELSTKLNQTGYSFEIYSILGMIHLLDFIMENLEIIIEYGYELEPNKMMYKYIGDDVLLYSGVIKVINSLDNLIKYIYDYSCDGLDWEYITE